ncbi:membrane protein [Sporolactobacillus laevolacticus]|uniref:Membrane protein n=1 Tax=Sporolactobacillus laevolacticus DSM 442 TaxID=1395513 RepID=V6IVQ4_9BACL|nr:membrane protein [Sporolactobacillus laevolacticus]EST11328.1 membrane protein [Sporolactobacillus laevolacticus DSM 442]
MDFRKEMYVLAKHTVYVKSSENIGYFVLSIFLNALGNALTVSLNLGSALWTASAVNFTQITSIPLSLILFASGVIVIMANALIIGKFDWRRVLGNLIFLGPFSYLIGIISTYLISLGINELPLTVRIILDVVGICFIAMAISIYQRVNIMLHPCDDLMQIIRFKYFKGSATIAQLVTFSPPIVIILVCWIDAHQLFAINVGTIFALIFQGTLVGIFDKCIFPTLKHQHVEHTVNHQHGLSY